MMRDEHDADRLVRIGQVGVGYWGKNLLRNFSRLPSAEVVSACDQRDAILESVAAGYPGMQTTNDFDELLQDDSIEAIVVATRTPTHAELAEKALLAGKHVFVEKPLAQSVEDARRLVELSEERGLVLMVGHLLIYHPAFRYVDALIESGDLGDVYYLYSTRVNLGVIRQKENALESLAPHDLAVSLRFIKRRPVAVAAHGQAYLQPGVEDVAFATVFFEDGRIAHLHTSWLDPHKIRKVTVVGSRRMAVIDDMQAVEKVRLYDKGVEIATTRESYANYAESMSIRVGDIHIPKIDMQEPLRVECAHFVDCIRRDLTPETDGRDGLAVVSMMDAMQQSLRSDGARVNLKTD
jgi:predicted dehydrogenase